MTPAMSGSMVGEVGDNKSLITYVKSDRLDWTFIGIAEYEALLGEVTALKKFILWVMCVIHPSGWGDRFIFYEDDLYADSSVDSTDSTYLHSVEGTESNERI